MKPLIACLVVVILGVFALTANAQRVNGVAAWFDQAVKTTSTPTFSTVTTTSNITSGANVIFTTTAVGPSVAATTGGYFLGSGIRLMVSATTPTISSGFGTSPSIASGIGTGAFTINVGTGGSAQTGVIGFTAATTGWRVNCDDVTTKSATVYLTKQTAVSTTTATIGLYDAAGAAAAWAASDILVCDATAY